MDIEKLISELTLDEKIFLVSGRDFMYTNGVSRLSIPSLCFSDGPHGLRKEVKRKGGIPTSAPATAFPTACATASGWDVENLYKMGKAMAEECVHYGVDVLLGPGVNIKRNPRCGRNFEYFSEDPVLSGRCGAALINGVQSLGVGVAVKHFACNNNEDYRYMGNSVADARALYEIYFKPFEYIVKNAKPYTVMCAYNMINGVFCSENEELLNGILRDKWGFDGLVMSDWGAVKSRELGIAAGLDLEMPGGTAIGRKHIRDAVKKGGLPLDKLDKAVFNVLSLAEKCKTDKTATVDFDKNNELAADIAADCAVLMKNDGILPIKDDKKLFVAGELFDKMRYQGAGSSLINATKITSAKKAFEDSGIEFEYHRGYNAGTCKPDAKLVDEAVSAASGFDRVLVFAGLTDAAECEGEDRADLRLPENQLRLINGMIDAGKKVIVVLFGGSVTELPFADGVRAILNMFLPGQNGGVAVKRLLFGQTCPSGRLAETWVKRYEDVPYADKFASGINEIYKESVFVGYRYYTTAKKAVAYPFGFGLSYTSFEYSDMSATRAENGTYVTLTVKNTGGCRGREVVQLYVSSPHGAVSRPRRELKAFEKVGLDVGESREVKLFVSDGELGYYDKAEDRFVLQRGEYIFSVCRDAETEALSKTVFIDGEEPESVYDPELIEAYETDAADIPDSLFERVYGGSLPAEPHKLPISLESRFTDLQYTFLGSVIYRLMMRALDIRMRRAKRKKDAALREHHVKSELFIHKMIKSNSLRTMAMSAPDYMPYNLAQAISALSNGKIFSAVKHLFKKTK